MVAVGHRRAWRVPHVVAEDIQPPAKVDILEEGEVVVVESAHLKIELAADQHGAAAGEQYRARFVEVRLPLPMVELEAVSFEVHTASDEIDGGTVPVEDARADTGDLRLAFERLEHLIQPGGLHSHVVVEEADPITGRNRRGPVVALGGS